MSLLQYFRGDLSKVAVNRISELIGDDEDLVKELMDIINGQEILTVKYALWVMRTICDKKPYLFQSYFKDLFDLIHRFPGEDGVLRNVIGAWQVLDIPEELEGEVYELCLNFLTDQSPIAAKAFSMEVCFKVAARYPELKNELKTTIEGLNLKYGESSPGIASRAKKTLRKIKELR